MIKTTVLGSGSWGTALAHVASQNSNVTLWGRDLSHIKQSNTHFVNEKYLPNIAISNTVNLCDDLEKTLKTDALIIVIPAQQNRSFLKTIAQHVHEDTHIVLTAKGIEEETLLTMSEVAHQILPYNPISVLSGPSFASEVAKNLPTAVTIAGQNLEHASFIKNIFSTQYFRTYVTDDIIGTQIGGSVKNVLAIASGICLGKKLGENAKASLITRGSAEMIRLGLRKSARLETLIGLSGFGDVVLSCSSTTSRNMMLGFDIGAKGKAKDILSSNTKTTEGVFTAKSLYELSKKHAVEMPLCESVYDILYNDVHVDDALQKLLSRPSFFEANY